MSGPLFYLAVMDVYDPDVTAVRTLYFANRGYVTTPDETPANTVFDARIKQPAAMSRDCWSANRTGGPSRAGYGDLVLLNGDGELDFLLYCGVDGRAVTLYQGEATPQPLTYAMTTAMFGSASLANFSAAQTVDGDTATKAWDTDTGSPGDNVPWDFGTPVNVQAIGLYMSAAGYDRTYLLAYSDDGLLYDYVPEVLSFPAAGWNDELVTAGGPHRYWFLELVESGTAGPDIMEMRAVVGWTHRPAFPDDFDTVLVGTMAGLEVTSDLVTIKLRDRQAEAMVPLQATKYAGNNTLPDGLEGTADDLEGKPKPLCFGDVQNVPAVCVNTSKLIYQVNDGPIFKLAAVYDRGIPLGGRTFATQSMSTAFGTNPGRWACEGADGTLVVAGGLYTGSLTARVDYSTDGGVTWQASDTSGMSSYPQAVAYGNGSYVVQCAATAVSLYAAATAAGPWTAISVATAVATNDVALGISYVNGTFLAYWGSPTRSSVLLTSTDASAWTSRTLTGFNASAEYCYHIDHGAGVYVAVGATGRISYSQDAATWVEVTAVGTLDLKRVVYADGQFLVVGSSGQMLRSKDGAVWETAVNAPLGSLAFQALAHGAGRWIAGGAYSGAVVRSADGYNWFDTTNPYGAGTDNLNYAIWSSHNLHFLLVGDGGQVFMDTGAVETYANVTAMLDDANAPAPGEVKCCVTGGYFRLGSSPDGTITADVVEGAATANRTAGQLFLSVVSQAGITAAYVTSDITALDASAAYPCGFWTATEMAADAVLDQIAESVGAWWGVDKDGRLRIQQLTAPSGTPAATFVANDLLRFERVLPFDGAIPPYKVILRWGRVYEVQTDLAGAATDAHRNLVGREWREVVDSDTDIQTQYLLAPQLVVETLLADGADAATEAARLLALRGTHRDLFDITVALTPVTATLDLGNVVRLTHARYGLTAGRLFRITGVRPDLAATRISFTLWG